MRHTPSWRTELNIEPEIDEYHDCFCNSSIVRSDRILSMQSQIHILELPKWEKLHKQPITAKDLDGFTELDYFMCFFSDKTKYKELKLMEANNDIMKHARVGLEAFVGDPANIEAYEEAQEAERLRADRDSFVIDETMHRVAVKMIKNKINIEAIEDCTDFSREEILKIKHKIESKSRL